MTFSPSGCNASRIAPASSLRGRSLAVLWRSVEVRAFYGVLAASIALISLYLTVHGEYASFGESLRHTVFHVVSIATTTGEGITTPKTFTRVRRCVLVENLRII